MLEENQTQQPALETSQPAQEAAPAAHPEPGDRLEGTITQVGDDFLLVDVGDKADGMVPQSELLTTGEQTLADAFHVGDRIAVEVVSRDPEGALLLSHRRAAEAAAWARLEHAYETGEVLTAPVTGQVKGGLVVDLGVRGFMPASQVERGYVGDLSVYVGQPVRVRVVELDRERKRAVVSQKAVLEEEHQRLRERTWADLREGQVRKGVVKGLTDFGAFVDLGGVDGLLHVSEMAWGRVEKPSDVVQVGDELDVKILRLDPENERISLGLKQVLPDPWQAAAEKYTEGSVVEGQVMRLAPFGAFVQLEPGIEGLVHVSQLADHHVNTPDEVVQEGQMVRVRVLRVQPDEHKISLSIKEADRPAGAFEAPITSGRGERRGRGDGGRKRERAPRNYGRTFSGESQGVTLGDMFGDLLAETKERLAENKPKNE